MTASAQIINGAISTGLLLPSILPIPIKEAKIIVFPEVETCEIAKSEKATKSFKNEKPKTVQLSRPLEKTIKIIPPQTISGKVNLYENPLIKRGSKRKRVINKKAKVNNGEMMIKYISNPLTAEKTIHATWLKRVNIKSSYFAMGFLKDRCM